MLLIHIAHSMNRLNLSHLTQFIGILLLCKTEMRRAVPSTQVTLHCQCQCSGGKWAIILYVDYGFRILENYDK